MAPEVYRDRCCSEQSEIYSLGLLLYYLLQGNTLPFMNALPREAAIEKRLAGAPLPEVGLRDRDLSVQLNDLIRWACDPEPRKRPQCFEALGVWIAALLEQAETYDREYPWLAQRSFDAGPIGTTAALPGVPPMAYSADPIGTTAALPDFSPIAYSADPVGTTEAAYGGPASDLGADPIGRSMALFGSPPMASEAAPLRPAPSPAGGGSPPPEQKTRGKGLLGFLSGFKKEKPKSPFFGSGARSMPAPTCPMPVPATPVVTMHRVHFSALAPEVFPRGKYSMVDIYMYEDAFRQVVDQAIAKAKAPVQEKTSGMIKVAEESRIRVVLQSPDVPLEDCEEEQVWYGEYLNFSFPVPVPEDYRKEQILFTAAVYINDVIATRLKFMEPN